MTTILLVEDSRVLRVATGRLLLKEGYNVIPACDGDEALIIARDQHPDLVILDLLLPKRSGPEVLRTLKSNVITRHIPVIVLSGMSDKNGQKLVREGAVAFLEKGRLLDDPQALLDAVKRNLVQSTVMSGCLNESLGVISK